jgi:hypothetical protein
MTIINTEEKVRLGIQVLVATVLWTLGYYKLALLDTAVLFPWRPVYEAIRWLVEPVLNWRLSKPLAKVEPVSRIVA